MAGKAESPVTPDGAQESVAALEAAAAAKAQEYDWNTLAAPMAMPSRTTAPDIKVDVIATIPEVIRMRAEASLAANVLAVKATSGSIAKRPRIDYDWRVQPVTTIKQGEAFSAMLGHYAKYRPADKPVPHADANAPAGQVTARCGETSFYRDSGLGVLIACDKDPDGAFLGIRYSVRPLEIRKGTARLPGTV